MAAQAKEKVSLPNLELKHHQMIYSIFLEVGMPSSPEAWGRVISRLPLRTDGRAAYVTQGASLFYRNMLDRWDEAQIFGENHDKLLAAALEPKNAPKNGNKRAIKELPSDRKKRIQIEKAGDGDKSGVDGGKKQVVKKGKVDKAGKGKGKEEVEVKDTEELDQSEEEFGKEKEPDLALHLPDKDDFVPFEEAGPSERYVEDEEEGEDDSEKSEQVSKKRKRNTKKVSDAEAVEEPVVLISDVEDFDAEV